MKNNPPTFSVLIPAYKSAKIIGDTIESILGQTFKDFELIIVDDKSPDNTVNVIKKYQKKDSRVKCFANKENLGYSGNLTRCRELATGKYVYLMGNDDILSKYALEKTLGAFKMDKDVGIVTRPYFWFENDNINTAVRAVHPLDADNDRIVDIMDGKKEFIKVLESSSQLSGLAYRRDFMTVPIHLDIFTAHIYPFLSIFKTHKAVFLKDYILAVRIFSSQTRSLSSIYEPSPTFTWVKMFHQLFLGKKYQNPRNWGIDYLARNYPGLIQIRCYARFSIFTKEVRMLIKYRLKNLVSLKFWGYTIFLTIMPRNFLIKFVDWYKKMVIGKPLKNTRLYDEDNSNFGDLQKQWYDKIFQKNQWSESKISADTKYFTERYLNLLGDLSGKKVLEIGCGDGLLTYFLLQRKEKKIFGVDISKTAIKNAKTQFAKDVDKGRLLLICDDIINYLGNKKDEKFDLIVGSGILHHIEKNQLRKLLTLVNGKLKKGGVFACAPEPNGLFPLNIFWRLAPLVYRLFGIDYSWQVEKGTLNMRAPFLRQILAESGFGVKSIKPFQLIPHFRLNFLVSLDKFLIDRFSFGIPMYIIVYGKKDE